MGLCVCVGYYADLVTVDEEGANWFRNEVERLNRFLESAGLSPHTEPENCPDWSADMFGYSGLHYLRRIAAHLELGATLPEPGGADAPEDPVLQEYYKSVSNSGASFWKSLFGRKAANRAFDHLINHSDAEGFYVPQDFPDVLLPPEDLEIPGGLVGSSVRLLEETRVLAEQLELPLDLDPESDEVFESAESQGEGDQRWKRYGIESYTCLTLHKAARLSIEHGALVVFA